MQLVVIARLRGRLAAHARDGVRIERGKVARLDGKSAAQRDRAAATLLERRVVEERVRPSVHDLVRQRRRLDRVLIR